MNKLQSFQRLMASALEEVLLKKNSNSPKAQVPGPGEYSVDKNSIEIKPKAPSFGFGTQKKSKDLSDSPLGPGSYETKTSFENALAKREFKQTSARP